LHADEDLRLARHAFKLKSATPYKLIAYHAQQCAEKCLKAYLVFEDRNKVNVDDLQGKKLLLTGYLHASKGDCKKAQISFDVAQQKGEECIPDEYKSNCK
jgi:hypothetical protein